MDNFNSYKYACLFGGGAIRGAAHVGVIKAFEEIGIQPIIYGGSSVGSIIAALYAVGYNHEELKEIFLNVNFELFRDISFGFTSKFAFSKGEVFLDWFREKIESKYYGDKYIKGENPPINFSDIDKNLVIISTNMKDFSCCEFSNYKTPDFEIAKAVRISCCMPGLMRAVTTEDKLLVDGDLMKGMPMWKLSPALENFSGRILEIRLEGEYTGSDTNPIEYVNGVYSCMTYCETQFIKSLYENNDQYDYIAINTGDVVVVDFNYPPDKRQQIIDSGYDQTIEFFKNTLKCKKSNLAGIYSEIYKKLKGIEIALSRKKFEKSKSLLGELFIYLSQVKEEIDKDIFNSILLFQKELYFNIKYGLLGYVYCKNSLVVTEICHNISENIVSRINDLNEYISKISV